MINGEYWTVATDHWSVVKVVNVEATEELSRNHYITLSIITAPAAPLPLSTPRARTVRRSVRAVLVSGAAATGGAECSPPRPGSVPRHHAFPPATAGPATGHVSSDGCLVHCCHSCSHSRGEENLWRVSGIREICPPTGAYVNSLHYHFVKKITYARERNR